MSREVPLRALEETLADAQERLIDSVCGPRWVPVRGLVAPFGCPRCGVREDFVRKGKRTRKRKLHTAVGTVELVLWNVGCRDCGRVFAPLLIMLGLSGKRRTDRLTVDLAELGTQVSFARAAELSRQLAGTTATAGRAGRYRRTAGRHRRHAGARAPGPGRGDARWHQRPRRDEQKRGGGAPGTGVDRPLRAGRAAPRAHPPTRG
jgi:transposase